MAGVNRVTLVGICGRDTEIRYSQGGASIGTVSLATSSQWNDKTTGEKREETQWHKITFYGKLADIAGQYLKKGRQVYIEGSIKYGKYNDKDGVEKNTVEIIASEMQLLGTRADSQNQDNDDGANRGAGEQAPRQHTANQPQSQSQSQSQPQQQRQQPPQQNNSRPQSGYSGNQQSNRGSNNSQTTDNYTFDNTQDIDIPF